VIRNLLLYNYFIVYDSPSKWWQYKAISRIGKFSHWYSSYFVEMKCNSSLIYFCGKGFKVEIWKAQIDSNAENLIVSQKIDLGKAWAHWNSGRDWEFPLQKRQRNNFIKNILLINVKTGFPTKFLACKKF